MSWSVGATGRAPSVKTTIAAQARVQSCSEPEETIRLAAIALIDKALEVQDPATVVTVQASGSQSTNYTTKAITNSLAISINPLHGFVE